MLPNASKRGFVILRAVFGSELCELPPIFWTGSVDKFSALYLLKKGEYHGEKTDTSQRRIQSKSCS